MITRENLSVRGLTEIQFWVIDKEAKIILDYSSSKLGAQNIIKRYEESDIKADCYIKGFYDIKFNTLKTLMAKGFKVEKGFSC